MSDPDITHWDIQHDGEGRISVMFGVVDDDHQTSKVRFSIPHHCVLPIIRSLTIAAGDVEMWHEGEDRILCFMPILHDE